MGYSISWIAVHGPTKAQILSRLSLRDTDELDEANESPVSGAAIAASWHVLFLNDLTHPFVSEATLEELSHDCELVGCLVEEHVMFSASFFYKNSRCVWRIAHEAENGLNHLETDGSPPAFFEEILSTKRTDQAAEGPHPDVDHIFDVPLETAERLCGYRHDRWQFDWGEPRFTQLVDVG